MNKSFYTNAIWASVLILVMFSVPMSVDACPACKTLDDPIGKGFNWSILFMIAMPFTVFGIIGGTIFLHFNSSRLSAISNQWVLMMRNLFARRNKRQRQKLTADR